MKRVVIFCWLLLCSYGAAQAQAARVFNLNQFTFEDTLGNKFNLDKLQGKVVFVDCWFPACPPCRAEMPYSKLLQERLHTMGMDSNIVFITISFRQSREEWLVMLKKLTMPNAIHLYSPASTYEATFAPEIFPTYRLFGTNGQLDERVMPKPSDFGKTDFVLYAATKGVNVYNALKIYLRGKAITERGLGMQKGELYEAFEKQFSRNEGFFRKQFEDLKIRRLGD